MRIFYAVHNEWEEDRNLYETLVGMGHEVIPCDWGTPLHETDTLYWQKKEKPRVNGMFLKCVKKAHHEKPIDLFFSYFYSSVVYPETIQEIRRWGILTVNYSCNNIPQFDLVEEIAPYFDFCMVPEEKALDSFHKVGARPVHIQMAANPRYYHPVNCSQEFDAIFLGQCYADRAEMIRFLSDQGIDVRVWGLGWRRRHRVDPFLAKLHLDRKRIKKLLKKLSCWEGWMTLFESNVPLMGKAMQKEDPRFLEGIPLERRGPPLPFDEMVRMYSRSRISLGFLSLYPTPDSARSIKPIRQREFEAPMSGAFYLTEYLPELERYYEIGKEIVCYRDKKELAEKVKYYLSHPEERERIRQAGYARALKEHTWEHRFQELFRLIGVPKKGFRS